MRRLLLKLALWLLLNKADEETKNYILTLCVKKHFNTISAEDLLKSNPDGTIQFGEEKFDKTILKELKNQAEFLDKLLLWKVLKKDVQYKLNEQMYYHSANMNDILFAKIGFWLFDEVIETRLKQLRKIEN